ncbi:MAG: hypothetical protein U0470_01125 [Anaerolineae bacterium]
MATNESVVSVEINARRRQLAVKTLMSGSGRHRLYQNFGQLAPHLRGEALGLLRQAVLAAGYASLAELDEALTSELVVPSETEAEAK